MSTNHGGPAFPSTVEAGEDRFGNKSHVFYRGMTLRDYFAGQALAGRNVQRAYKTWEDMAADCYEIADAMIAARGH